MAENEQKTCRSCKAPVKWLETDGPKRVIVDAKPLRVYVLTDSGKYDLFEAYQSHFVTCPDADKWRKKKPG